MDGTAEQYRIHPAWWTAVLIAVVSALIWVCSAAFAGTLTTYVPVTVTSDRAGVAMESGAKVKMRGVQVGRVAGVAGGQNPVRLQLELFPDQIGDIPANAEAQIRATTIFGAKYVDLIYPDSPSPQHISAGAVLRSKNVSTEVNTVFQSLVDVLHQVDPPKLNAVLTAFAEAVRGRGQRIGEATTAANNVLGAVNPRMGTVRQDLRSLKGGSDAYSAAAQHILATLDAASVTATTVTAHSAELNALLLNAIGFSQAGIELIGPNRGNLVQAINVLKPTTDLLMKYNPELTCLLMGAKWSLDNGAYESAGGNGRTIQIDDGLLFGDDPYRYPDNLPIVAAKGGPGGQPGCGSLPDVSKNYPVRQLVTNTGWGTGLDIRPNPGIGHPWYVDYFPVTRGTPQPPSVRGDKPPAIGPIPYPGAPPYGAPLYGPDGTPLYPPPPGAPPPGPPSPTSP
ncbi:MCE family protein [Mycobacterium sp.]|uniref:MCE family protein n=1 Tax=Mycobacterium sp. TaxID=1785 RepID=UPI003D12782A